MRYLATPQVVRPRRGFAGGALLADAELAGSPLHLTVVGAKQDAVARQLFLAGLHAPASYKQTEWYDPQEGKLPGPEISFPKLQKPAAFLCTGNSCSAPMSDPAALER